MSVETFIEQFIESGKEQNDFYSLHMKLDLTIKAMEVVGDSIKRGECWCYPRTDPSGYGKLWFNRKSTTASRLVLCAATNKPINYGMDACHRTPVCRFRNCVNPDHLYWETHSENCKRRELERKARATIAGLTGDLVVGG